MTLNLYRLIWKYLWDLLIEMSSKEPCGFSDITAAVSGGNELPGKQ